VAELLEPMPHLAHSAGPSLHNFFLFGFVKDNLMDRHSGTLKGLFREVQMMLSEILDEVISELFRNRQVDGNNAVTCGRIILSKSYIFFDLFMYLMKLVLRDRVAISTLTKHISMPPGILEMVQTVGVKMKPEKTTESPFRVPSLFY
jgi:hypothetical protein